jgi:hypothetical protein
MESRAGMTNLHPCLDCGQPGQFPLVYATGEMYGWACRRCDERRRRKRMGWRRRIARRLRHWLKI